MGRGARHAQQGMDLRFVQAEGLIHVGRVEGLELLSRVMGQDSTPHRLPTQATGGLEAAINRGRLQLLDGEGLQPVVLLTRDMVASLMHNTPWHTPCVSCVKWRQLDAIITPKGDWTQKLDA